MINIVKARHNFSLKKIEQDIFQVGSVGKNFMAV